MTEKKKRTPEEILADRKERSRAAEDFENDPVGWYDAHPNHWLAPGEAYQHDKMLDVYAQIEREIPSRSCFNCIMFQECAAVKMNANLSSPFTFGMYWDSVGSQDVLSRNSFEAAEEYFFSFCGFHMWTDFMVRAIRKYSTMIMVKKLKGDQGDQ